MRVKKHLMRFVSQETDREKRLGAARGEDAEFNALMPPDRLTALFVLSHDRDEAVARAASETMAGLDEGFVIEALGERLDEAVLQDIFTRFRDCGAVLSAMAANEGVDQALGKRIREAMGQEGQGAAGGAPTTQEGAAIDVEEPQPRHMSAYQTICNMTAGEKIKLAHTGDKTIRGILIKDKNRVVALAVLKNPKLTEQEVVMTVSSTSVSEEIIREIARSRQWMKSYNVKCAMIFNPHTPLSFSLKLVDHLRERELKQLAKSKGVPGALVNAAARKLKLRNRQ
jgi:hypothetical protein